jgi:hypothetical protein
MDVDARGRVWATEAVNYRQWRGRNPGLHDPAGDRVVILEDSDGDGFADTNKVFVQDKDLVAPLGIAVLGDAKDPKVTRVYVWCWPSIFLYTDVNGDDVPDKKEVFLTGFGGHDHDHGYSIVVGPDGRFYIAVGNAGPHIVTDKSGWTLRSGSIYAGGGENEATTSRARVGRREGVGRRPDPALRAGRIEPDLDGAQLPERVRGRARLVREHVHRGQRRRRQSVLPDVLGDGGRELRLLLRRRNPRVASGSAPRPGRVDRALAPGRSGRMPRRLSQWRGRPDGRVRVRGRPARSGVGRSRAERGRRSECVYAHTPVPDGGGYAEARDVPEVEAKGPDDQDALVPPERRASRRTDSVFVSDWWDPGVGGRLAGDKAAYGRILRGPKGRGLDRPRIDVSTLEGAIAALESPATSVRGLAGAALRSNAPRRCFSESPPNQVREFVHGTLVPDGQPEVVARIRVASDGGLRISRRAHRRHSSNEWPSRRASITTGPIGCSQRAARRSWKPAA